MPITIKDLETDEKSTWCGGCGDFPILVAVKKAIVELELDPDNFLIVAGIGCGSKLTHWIKTYGFHTIHGRPIPIATAAKLANHDLEVFVVAGDGDTYGIGANHFLQVMRRNVNMTVLVQNNMVYGLTKGQTSPTSMQGYKSKSTPHGSIEIPVNPIALALSCGATFIARTLSSDLKHMTEIIKKSITHRGIGFVDIFQPCVTFNKINTYAFFKQHCYKLDEEEGYNPTDLQAAYVKSHQEDKLPVGVFYQVDRPIYADRLPQLKDTPLVKQSLDVDISKAMLEFV